MRIDHPFFVKLHFTFQDDDRLCIFFCSHKNCYQVRFQHSVVCLCRDAQTTNRLKIELYTFCYVSTYHAVVHSSVF